MKTSRELTILSSPACSPRYEVIVPAGTPVEQIAGVTAAYAVAPAGFSMLRGANRHDLEHYFVWIPADAVEP